MTYEFFLGDTPHYLEAGDFLYMPPNLRHAVKATKQFSMLLTLSRPVAQAPDVLRMKTLSAEKLEAVR